MQYAPTIFTTMLLLLRGNANNHLCRYLCRNGNDSNIHTCKQDDNNTNKYHYTKTYHITDLYSQPAIFGYNLRNFSLKVDGCYVENK